MEEAQQDGSVLEKELKILIPGWRERLGTLKKQYGSTKLEGHSVQDIVSGSRGIKSILWETSKLHPDHGIQYRGFSIQHCLSSLPSASDSGKPLAEGLLWLMLTGHIPSPEQALAVSVDLRARMKNIPDFAFDVINALPRSAHPMTQLVSGIMALQTQSQFAQSYAAGSPTNMLWLPALEDCLNLISQVPILAAYIYRRSYRHGTNALIPSDPSLDIAANFCHMLGFDDIHTYDMMRMYMVVHCDHEGGAVSSHTVKLVSSALSDPYLAFAAGLNACAGPLHGLAIQDSFKWIQRVGNDISDVSTESLEAYVQQTLDAGKIIPGFGHALLKKTDPRFTCLYEFCKKNLPDNAEFQLLAKLAEVVPKVMKQQGKVRNPWPNVDAIIGVVFNHFGIHEESFFPVILGVARSIGALSQLVWDRALCLPIERPSSVTLDWIEQFCSKTGT